MTAAMWPWLFDFVLAGALPVLAWQILRSDELREAVVLFISFGLLVALAWARLDAPDIAMVEAAISAALTGVLLMSALGWMEDTNVGVPASPGVASLLLPVALAMCLGVAVHELAEPRPTVGALVLEGLEASGVFHPVTAVLLNFRGYDTLLEVIVLVISALGVRALVPASRARSAQAELAGPLLEPLVRGVLPLLVVVAGYLLWKGSHGPGGAFQAGATLAGGGMLLRLARPSWPPPRLARAVPGALVLGSVVFLSLAAALLFGGFALLEYPRDWAKFLIFSVEAVLTVSIAVALVLFLPRPLSSDAGDAGQ
jgi:multisubunit Na+/H+ antiporter MnhB subunit